MLACCFFVAIVADFVILIPCAMGWLVKLCIAPVVPPEQRGITLEKYHIYLSNIQKHL
jgi:hypothetical protein